jgi:hypothetical protein
MDPVPEAPELAKELYGTDDIGVALERDEVRRKALWHEYLYDTPVEIHSKMKLPYFAPEDSIPKPLPTVQDIERARNRGNIAKRVTGSLYELYRVNDVFVVKLSYSPAVIRVSSSRHTQNAPAANKCRYL